MHPQPEIATLDDRDRDRLQNLRDVGDLRGAGGRVRRGILYRSDAPHMGDEVPSDLTWPPRTVVDLRSKGELMAHHPLSGPNTRIFVLPLSAEASIQRMVQDGSERTDQLEVLYTTTIETAASGIVEAIDLIARAPIPVLVHCAAGKDRTGIVVAVVLAAVGVADDDIVTEYALTQDRVPRVLSRMAVDPASEINAADLERIIAQNPHVVNVSPPAIRAVLHRLSLHPGGAGGWLLDNGLSEDALAALRERLIEAERPWYKQLRGEGPP